MKLGIIKENANENRVAITPDTIAPLKKIGIDVIVETNAGEKSFYSDEEYKSAGATILKEMKSFHHQI
jgi:NAD(P) transhydrogenase subunit alpha